MSAVLTQSTPDWLAKSREAAASSLEQTPPPPNSSETWRRTPYALFKFDAPAFSGGISVSEGSVSARSVEGVSGEFFQRDASAPSLYLAPGLAEKGLRLMDLEAAARELPELVRPQLETAWAEGENRRLELLNASAWRHGAFLYVPKGVRLEAPVRFIFERGAAPFVHPRLLAVIGEGAELTLQEEHRSGAGEHGSIAFSKVVLGKNARASVIYQQELGPEARHYFNQHCVVGEGAQLTHSSLVLGGRLHKNHLLVEMAGRGARSELFGVTLGSGAQHFDSYTHQWHHSPKTSSDLLFRTALRERSRSVYNGLIRIEKEAVETQAYQANNNLLLSDKARADSTPILEILTDEVSCKHGATAGPLGKEELFYLQSRGFSPEEAQKTLIMGFFEPVLKRLPLASERERLAAEIERRL